MPTCLFERVTKRLRSVNISTSGHCETSTKPNKTIITNVNNGKNNEPLEGREGVGGGNVDIGGEVSR